MAADDPDQALDADDDLEWHCYKHPAREAGVKCRRCERPICPDCMISAPVGFQCRECVKGAPAVRTLKSLRPDPYVTMALVAVNAVVFLGQVDSSDIGLFGPAVAAGDWWRIVTSGFLHYDILHIGFNMVLLWWLGSMLEPSLGRLRFGILYAGALVAGSLGVLLLDPNALTGGASGAVFGLMAATFLSQRRRGIDPMQTGIGGLILINLLLSFRPGVSIGGHLGGLVGGALLITILDATDGSREQRWLGAAAAALVTLAIAGASLYVASNPL
ncbi:MAG: Rhomboid family protein [Actinomycetia bacterium]|nr:Rhomboid family protein [Actinomycetes bacterium]